MLIDHTTQYANKVVSGEIIACRWIIKACERHLNDIERSKKDDYPYYFDVKKAEFAINFSGVLANPENGEPIELLLFQKWIIGSLKGWVSKKTGYRRFRKCLLTMARRNGKTLVIDLLGVNELLAGEYPKRNRKVVFASNAMKQARIGFEYMQDQLEILSQQSKAIKRDVKVLNDSVKHKASGSKAFPVASDTGKLDGFAASLAIIDEWHESKDRKMYKVLKTGQIALKNALIAVVSTAGLDPNVPMYSEVQSLKKVLNGELEMEDYFVAIYEQDDVEKEVDDPSTWIKSNPILEHPELREVIMDSLKGDLVTAREQGDLNDLFVKNYNVWRQATAKSYMAIEDWEACGTDNKPDIYGSDVYIGADMSKVDDLTSISFIHCLNDFDKRFFVDSHSFVGTKGGLEAKIKRDKIDYYSLSKQGYCTITDKESGTVNQKQVVDYIKSYVKEYDLNVKAIYFDAYNISMVLNDLEEFDQIEVKQTAPRLNQPTKDFRLLVYDKRMIHNNNPLLTIAVNNAITIEMNDLIRLDKSKNRNKIDPIAATITAHSGSLDHYLDSNEPDDDYFANYKFTS